MRARRAGAAACIAAAALGCARPAEQRYRERVAGASEAAVHGVHGERLSEQMRGLDRLARDRLPRSLDVSALREHRVAEVARVANAIADSAAGIPGAAGELGLDTEERAEFAALAVTLERGARGLAADARGLGGDALDARARELEATCEACHVRFRLAR